MIGSGTVQAGQVPMREERTITGSSANAGREDWEEVTKKVYLPAAICL